MLNDYRERIAEGFKDLLERLEASQRLAQERLIKICELRAELRSDHKRKVDELTEEIALLRACNARLDKAYKNLEAQW